MSRISKPDINISILPASSTIDIGERRDLIIFQTPNATANALVQDLHDYTQDELDSLLGSDSFARILVQQWFKTAKTGTYITPALDMIVLAEHGSATTSDIVLALTGTSASEDKQFEISILSSDLYKKTITVTTGDTPTVIGAAIETAYSAVTAPFTVSASTGTVTITSTDAGTLGNSYGIEIKNVPAGITATITPAAGGTNPPTVTDVMDLVGTRRYQGILWPNDLSSSKDEVTDWLDDRFNYANEVLDGVAFMGFSDTLANCKSQVTSLNTQSLVVLGNEIVSSSSTKDGPEIVHPVDLTACEFMAARSRRLTEDAAITSVITTNASGDQIGGKALASLPYFNTPLDNTPITDSINLFNGTEQAELNEQGFSVIGPNRANTGVVAGTIVTTYKTDAAGNEDVSFKYLNYVDTASVCREYLFVNLKAAFAQSRLTDGDLIPRKAINNSASIKSAFKLYTADLKDAALVRSGSTADQIIDDNLEVVIDLAARSATVYAVLPIVTQLETVNIPLKLTFES